jgi:hypothetical protein
MGIIGKVTSQHEETIGMIQARRWAEYLPWILGAIVCSLLGWRMTVLFAALTLVIRVEAKRVRAASWLSVITRCGW